MMPLDPSKRLRIRESKTLDQILGLFFCIVRGLGERADLCQAYEAPFAFRLESARIRLERRFVELSN